ncbi:MAG: NAD(P)-dependent glycerol-1-phosphate dehydrogenase [Methanomassiliicoccaceae archaeon]|jgi:glycerol-1-phosphate dehydrogenase [NAD(P)+]|nr:NAD(P)-dependent glycerol-1-phosphate dehydrogenase [Methanomassiliicoccaceae archaeon]
MDDFDKYRGVIFPRNLLLGHNILGKVAEVCDDFRFPDTGIIVTGDDTYKAAGRDVQISMEESKYNIHVHKAGAATLANADKIFVDAEETGSEFILAVGGGSKIDLAKIAAKKLKIPFISIPTSAAHDGIASGRASMKSDLGPLSVEGVVPMAVVADTGVITKSPYRLLASGCADVISNLTAIMDWKLGRDRRDDDFSSSAALLSEYSAEAIIESSKYIRPDYEHGVWVAMRPIILSGISMSIAGSSRPTSGAEHMFSHALDILHPGTALHGEQCGVGAIMLMHLHGGNWKRIRNALIDIGAPVNAEQLGLRADDIIDALTEAHKIRTERFTILGDRGLTKEKAEAVARTTMVI